MKNIMMLLVMIVVSNMATANVHSHIEKMRTINSSSVSVEKIDANVVTANTSLKFFHNRAAVKDIKVDADKAQKTSSLAVRPQKFRR